MKIDVPHMELVEISYELGLLESHLELLEEQVEFQRERSRFEVQNKIVALDLDPRRPDDEADYQLLMQEHHHLVDEVLPRVLINPFIVSVWAQYETAIKELAGLIQEKQGEPLSISDIKGKHLVDRVEKYFRHVLNFPIGYSDEVKKKLNFIGALRNAIVHSYGRLSGLSKKNRKAIRGGEFEGVSRGGAVIIDIRFARTAFETVRDHLEMLMERYKTL